MKFFLIFLITLLYPISGYSFEIYQYIFWKDYIDQHGKHHSNSNNFQVFLKENHLKPIEVIYQYRFLTNNKPDKEKIKKIVAISKLNPTIPISFDIEVGNKFKPETVLPVVNETLDLYHQYGGAAPVGIFGVLPQNLFGSEDLNPKTKQLYKELNKQYEGVAQKVNFLSPVVYNLWFRDYNEWVQRTDFHIEEAKKYAKKYNLKVIPYFSSSYLDRDYFNNNIIYPLAEKEIQQRLNYIHSKNVDGVIIWDSSIGFLKNGNRPIFNVNKGGAKAIIKFSKSYNQ
ncbi:hypothetical protein KTH87_13610 [Acinetobacter baumannii]|nr:hypothetical protein [Acinetobacter baumannii]HAV4219326.1 hypothetical protein [Acinetobacter baumannii]